MDQIMKPDLVYEDFPGKQRRHYQESRNGQLARGMEITGNERQDLDHINRVAVANEVTCPILGSGASMVAAPVGAPRGNTNEQWMSTYQRQCLAAQNDHSDDVGQFGSQKKRGLKKVLPNYAQSSRSLPLAAQRHEGLLSRSTVDALFGVPFEHPANHVGSMNKEVGHVPGYTGHIPRSADVVVKPRHINKDLIEDNYRFNVTGYTGVTR
mmetsp:Transcript_29913/g.50337  ORF Transcript_29913/g.50337 Transcript_29913/m.50337 type:complete len:210 (+) Transcript_29913:217-846(+)|eukprot:CAMPEP_0198228734 /NCGR_PEP_ID=MMETSP1445-20131203/113753_1 /TAXON_ID=36898 /ORGANISM="Pyramimonas sp., Strain CCMP2087" /LENGTH=209 /DNA_ID=CAMNT_0043909153 /DNA_START=178 /DNA_END=810 /DNA_ORIENTATION=-